MLIIGLEKAAHIDVVAANRKAAAAKRKIIVKLEWMQCLFDGARIGNRKECERQSRLREIFCT